jgi:hypothetical protein
VKGNTFRHGVVVPVHQPDVFLETHPVTLRSERTALEYLVHKNHTCSLQI